MFIQLQDHINSKLSFLKQGKLLIAISGGIDSVVLTYLCHKIGLNIALAHCNFNLRGKESDADEDFVLQIAEDLDLEVFIESFDTDDYAKKHKLSIQMAARELRYNWFGELAVQLNFDYILTAHHADDNLETFLINFTRGTGLDGLKGIPEVNNIFVRPLLSFSRYDIESYAKMNGLKWRDDSSNALTKYLRNKLRHDVIPILKEINPSLLQSFQNTISNLKDTRDIADDRIKELIKGSIIKSIGSGYKLDISEIKKFNNPKAYLYQFLHTYGFTEWDDIVNLLDGQSGKQILSNHWRLIKDRNYLLLSEIGTEEFQPLVVFETDKKIDTPLGILSFVEVDSILEISKSVIYVDENLLEYPLIIRKWQEGDYFYPMGMIGKKKLSKYFKDEKLSLLDKENTLLLCSENDIIWVLNQRADNRYKVTENTKKILKIELK